jgi:hypothetical protein
MGVLERLKYGCAKTLLFVFQLWVLFKASPIYQFRWTPIRLLFFGFMAFILIQIHTQGKMALLRRREAINLLPPIEEEFKPQCGGHFTSERKPEFVDSNVISDSPRSTLVVYNYYESEGAVDNLRFFVRHGLHERPDVHFLFVFSSEPCISVPLAPNVAIVHASRGCYGFAAIKSALVRFQLQTTFKKYILTGSWVKGPFMPTWSTDCWTDAFTRLLTDYYQISGTTYNCIGPGAGYARARPHLHPTAWAVTQNSLMKILSPFYCPSMHDLGSASDQTSNYQLMKQEGLGATALVSALALDPLDHCPSDEWEFYEHPFETIFANPRNSKTLKRDPWIYTPGSAPPRPYDYLAVSEIAMKENNYDSRKYCSVHKAT